MSSSEQEDVHAPAGGFEHFEDVHPALVLDGHWDDLVELNEFTIHSRSNVGLLTRWVSAPRCDVVDLLEVR